MRIASRQRSASAGVIVSVSHRSVALKGVAHCLLPARLPHWHLSGVHPGVDHERARRRERGVERDLEFVETALAAFGSRTMSRPSITGIPAFSTQGLNSWQASPRGGWFGCLRVAISSSGEEGARPPRSSVPSPTTAAPPATTWFLKSPGPVVAAPGAGTTKLSRVAGRCTDLARRTCSAGVTAGGSQAPVVKSWRRASSLSRTAAGGALLDLDVFLVRASA